MATIATELGVHRSTLYREQNRNSGKKGYYHKQANTKAIVRRRTASAVNRKMTPKMLSLIKEKLKLQWSPVQISGRLKAEGYENAVSYEAIYQHIWKDKKEGGLLYLNLRHRGKKYNKRSKTKAGRGYIPNCVDIEKRPAVVEEKTRLGDWELDLIIGAGQSGAIVSMVDRASKLTKLLKVNDKRSKGVELALIKRLGPIKDFVLTLTSDNGKEFATHESVSAALEADFYFAKPYHSWERGLNEHTNGLVRQYFSKSKRFDEISAEELLKVEILLNNRPRKVLGFSTPVEVFVRLSEAA